MNIIALDVGGTFIKHALMNEEGTILSQGKVPTPRKEDQEAFLKSIDGIVNGYKDVEGIAMSLPGTINIETGYVSQGGSLVYNSKTNLKEIMEARYHLPVELENDARCAATAELTCGNLKDIANGIVLTFGTGVGGCFIIDGKIHRGTHYFAGEVSMTITKDIRQYGLEAVWGSGSQGSVPGLVKRICEAKQTELVDGPEVFEWIAQKDEIACGIFQEYCYQIAVQLFNFQIALDPQRVCIGGGVSANPLFVGTIQAVMNAFYDSLGVPLPRLEIMPCKFHNDSNLIGAYYHYQMMRKRRA